ncbi:MAG: ABC transporter substrate-binding protein [Oscillatoriaceae cyanobacterium]
MTNNKWQRWGQFIGLFCICLFLTVSCGGSKTQAPQTTQSGSQQGGDVGSNRITIGTTAKIRTLDPADAYDLASGMLLENMGDRLYTYADGTRQLQPHLAAALPTVSSDGLTYTIPLRSGVTFHDRTPFNAEAMAFSLKRFMENRGQPSFLLSDTISSITATAEYELTIKLKKPFAAFPALLTFFGACAVSPKHYQIGAGKFQPDTFVGTGPYKLAELGTDKIKLDVFENYWGKKPANQGIDIQRLSNPVNLYNAFRTGAVDVAYETLDPDQIRSLEQMAPQTGWQVLKNNGNFVSYWVLNVKKPPLDNQKVRQALAAIIDRNLLIERVQAGQADPLYSLIPSNFDAYKPTFKERYGDDGNTALAKQLLTEAGYNQSNPLKLEIWYPSTSPVRGLVASALKAIAEKQLGGILQLQLNSVEFTTASANLDKGVYQTFLFNWVPDFYDPDNFIYPFLSCPQGNPTTGCQSGGSQSQGSFYYNPTANQLLDQQRQELNPEKRAAMLGQIQDLIAKEVPYIPLFQNKDYAFAQKHINGVTLDPSRVFPMWNITKTKNS